MHGQSCTHLAAPTACSKSPGSQELTIFQKARAGAWGAQLLGRPHTQEGKPLRIVISGQHILLGGKRKTFGILGGR